MSRAPGTPQVQLFTGGAPGAGSGKGDSAWGKGKNGGASPPYAWAAAAANLGKRDLDAAASGETPPAKVPALNDESDEAEAKAAPDMTMKDGDEDVEKDEEEEEGVEKDEEGDIKSMMKVMMKDMKEVKSMMRKSEQVAREARDEARSAKQTALEAKIAVSAVETGLTQLKEMAITKDNLEETIRAMGKITTEEEVTKIVEESLQKTNLGIAGGAPSSTATLSTVLVVGGLRDFSFKASAEWLQKFVRPIEVYRKDKEGKEFKGLVFAKFANEVDASLALQILRDKLTAESLGGRRRTGFGVMWRPPSRFGSAPAS